MTKGLMILMLAGYAVTIWITYEILKVSIKDALKELKAAEKKAAEIEESKILGNMANDLSYMNVSDKNKNVIID
jgi:hypothetical protein